MDNNEKYLKLTEDEFNYLLLELDIIGSNKFLQNIDSYSQVMEIQKRTLLKVQKLKELFESGL